MEAPPSPRVCTLCQGDGTYRCTECIHRPLFCSSCCRKEHKLRPFHCVEQWNGTFFEESSLQLAGLVVHLGHGGDPCPSGGLDGEDIAGDVEDEWEDIEDQPKPHHLSPGTDRSCLTLVHTSGVHFCDVRYCNCPGAETSHLQLATAGLFPETVKEPRTAFTFQVLDDFIQDNVECGTSAMNYYSKLQRVTSNAFPNLVPVSSMYDINTWVILLTLIQEQIQGAAQTIESVEVVKAVQVARISSGIP
ncbi:hypothetical protein SCLCIDRAFT_140978 [Scleroderma citrinum Foug A]|uniref:CxC2-like cysteine cluster KDZ transposase-associated domain-containing protein n=1 Tax=Scleroderma citrinum Foug A TaxID=1036808 RepID=A0A0C3D8S1_9AGAM|nr:hypothetical protein SCLCIDRAFT_140978 [Scleroderma citrinum Foug A]